MKNIYEVLEALRSNPEKSGEEVKTRSIIREYMQELPLFKEEQIGQSLVYCYKPGGGSRKCIALREDFDAVLTDDGTYEHRCGHHGHTAILLNLAARIDPAFEKSLVLIFQSAEENAAGAPELISNGLFDKYKPDLILGCHNFPGYKENAVMLRSGKFNYSVVGFNCRFIGRPSHAAHPEHGSTPAFALARLAASLEKLNSEDTMLSITHMKLGEHQYGTSPGEAVILGTIRSLEDDKLTDAVGRLKTSAERLAAEYGLKVETGTSEYFKGIVNSAPVTERVREICKNLNYNVIEMEEYFRAGEDFGFYLDYVEGCYFGIGAGEGRPELHTENYSFNTNNLEYTAKLLFDLISEL